jgi:hypothetical protein
VNYFLLDDPAPVSALGCWEGELSAFTHIIGYSGLGHFFLHDKRSGEFGVCHPFLKAYKNYGAFPSVSDFERQILRDEGFSEFVLRPDLQAEIEARAGSLDRQEIYIPAPYPFLGGSGEPDTYHKGNFWTFAELVGMSHGFGDHDS